MFRTKTCGELRISNVGEEVTLAGWVQRTRKMGGMTFVDLRDRYGITQLVFNAETDASLCEQSNHLGREYVIQVTGKVSERSSKNNKIPTGDIEIIVSQLNVLNTSEVPPFTIEDESDGGDDIRMKYRYLDLRRNAVRKNLELRHKMTMEVRRYLDSKGFLEVETPILQPIYGGAAARPFKTHHNTLDRDLYLRISNELYLKRLIVGGYDGVYEFSKDFRNEGMDRYHNPEFTQVELYVAYKDYKWMMSFVEEMLSQVAEKVTGNLNVQVGDNIISFKTPWQRYTMFEIIEKYTGIDISDMDEEKLRDVANSLDIYIDPTLGYGKIIDEIFGAKCEPNLIQPTFIIDYPVEMSPLAKQKVDDPKFVERFELFINGKECANAFSELNDPIEQRKRFEDELDMARRGDPEAMQMDEDFINAISYGMPPTAGVGIGIDRLTMIMTNATSIQEVIFFPQMRN